MRACLSNDCAVESQCTTLSVGGPKSLEDRRGGRAREAVARCFSLGAISGGQVFLGTQRSAGESPRDRICTVPAIILVLRRHHTGTTQVLHRCRPGTGTALVLHFTWTARPLLKYCPNTGLALHWLYARLRWYRTATARALHWRFPNEAVALHGYYTLTQQPLCWGGTRPAKTNDDDDDHVRACRGCQRGARGASGRCACGAAETGASNGPNGPARAPRAAQRGGQRGRAVAWAIDQWRDRLKARLSAEHGPLLPKPPAAIEQNIQTGTALALRCYSASTALAMYWCEARTALVLLHE